MLAQMEQGMEIHSGFQRLKKMDGDDESHIENEPYLLSSNVLRPEP